MQCVLIEVSRETAKEARPRYPMLTTPVQPTTDQAALKLRHLHLRRVLRRGRRLPPSDSTTQRLYSDWRLHPNPRSRSVGQGQGRDSIHIGTSPSSPPSRRREDLVFSQDAGTVLLLVRRTSAYLREA
jgi:hypothetical protein